jgi:hypothetical protein
MSLKHIKEYTDTLPQHLLHSLCTANVKANEIDCIKTKLQERTSSSIVSYLQLALIKLQKTSVAASDFSSRMTAQQERTAYGAFLEERLFGQWHVL